MDAALSLPLSFAQERLWFLEQLGMVGPAYNIPVTLRLEGVLDVVALERSFAALIERHESLRTRFERVEGRRRRSSMPGRVPARDRGFGCTGAVAA